MDFVDPRIQKPFILCFSDLDGVATISIAYYAGLTNLVPAHPTSGLMACRVLEVKSMGLRIAGQFQTIEASRLRLLNSRRSRKSSALPAINPNTISRRRRLIWSQSVLGRSGERWHPNLSPSYIVRALSCRVALRLPRFKLNRRRGLDTSARPGLLTWLCH